MRYLLTIVFALFIWTAKSFAQTDSATSVGSDKFKTNKSKKFWMGANYRTEWKTPITVPVLHLATEKGGLKPVKRGGGKQTKSLRVEDPNGKQYTLRSIQKFITSKTLPGGFESEAAADLVQDGVSASYPYSALSVLPLNDAAGIPHGEVKLVYIPDDPALGEFREDFKNMLAFLEEKVPAPYDKDYDSDEVIDKLKDDNDNNVDQLALLRIRILDMFVMDLDRHEGQWTWVAKDNGKGKTFIPIAKDRDQAFYTNQGVLPGIVKWPWLVPQLEGFKAKAHNIDRFNFAARNFDRFFLNGLTEQQWRDAAEMFKSQMTDAVLEKAIDQQPREIRHITGDKILATLKERRNYIVDEVMQYYRFLAETVSITGSDKKELFEVNNNSNGSTQVTVYKITKEGEQSIKMYDRTFTHAGTKEIRLYGMGGEDKFTVKGSNGNIKVRMIGGMGDDEFENTANGRGGIVYDSAAENNKVSGQFRNKISNDTSVNKFDFLGFKYNQTIPFISANFNSDDGVFLGFSLKFIRHGFRKEPYKTLHSLVINHAFATNAWNFKWGTELIGALGKNTDVLFNADIKSPSTTTNFFGYGNSTVFDKSNANPEKKKFRYYRARYSLGDVSLLLRRNFGKKVNITFGPAYQYFHLEADENFSRYITTSPPGINPATLYAKQSYGGGIFTLNVDTRNHPALAYKGITWNTSVKVLKGLNDESYDVTQLRSDFAFYLRLSKNLVLTSRFGGGHNFGDFEFYQAQFLNSLDNLRGYRKYRFAGESMAFNNTELRIRFGDFRSYLFPGSIGMVLFHDIGRVWHDLDGSDSWHSGYGGGVWIAPLKRFVISVMVTSSKESTLPLIGFGWQF
jgi:hypothetical protein